jgi:tripartite-type tricarboxylate transporter receptor subunit TctC
VIAAEAVAKSVADGYTLFLCTSNLTSNPAVFARLPYDTLRDFTPIVIVYSSPTVLFTGPDQPFRTVRDVVEAARRKPGLAASTSGVATSGHFATELFMRKYGIELTHVPYRGAAPAFNDLYGSSIAAISLTLADLVKPAEAKKLRIIGVSGAKRSPFAPEAPTFAEQGLKNLDRDDWFGLYIVGQPSLEVVQRLSALTKEVQTGAVYQKALRASFLEPAWSTPAELDKRGHEDLAYWGPIIKATGFKAEV